MPRRGGERHEGFERPVLDLCAEAGAALRSVGFEHVCTSMKSESTYYRLPGRFGLLRISCHPSKRSPIGLDDVVATLTFRGPKRCRHLLVCSPAQIENMIWMVVGQYVMRSAEPIEPRYQGPGISADGRGLAVRR